MLLKVVIAGGGTGGHLFPGVALAEELVTRHPENEVLFVGTAKGLEATHVPKAGFKLELIEVQGLKGKGLGGLVKGLLAVPRALLQARRILLKYRPSVVIGVGGYASGPTVAMAWWLGIPTAVQEQNALPGLTNKILGKLATRCFVAFDEALRYFPASRSVNVGNPIRRALLENFLRPKAKEEGPRLLVFGGSLGAHPLNVATVEAVKALAAKRPELQVLHQTGVKDLDETKAAYEAAGLSGRVTAVAFIDDMSTAYAQASVVACRAGATTLAELTVCKKAAVLVPFPQAADDHQTVNARALVDRGAAVLLPQAELTGASLAAAVEGLLADEERRRKMERASGLLGRPEAAKEIADVLVRLAFGEPS